MSDEAAAPVEAVETPAEGGEAPAKAAPKVEEDPLDALLKTKPVKYKAAGKEKTITTSKDLQRLLSRVDGTDTAAAEALKVKQANDAREAKVKSLAKMPKAERLRVLEEMGIPRNVIFEAFEEDVLTSAEKEKAQAQLTPRERELQEKLEAHEARVAEFEKAEQQRQQQEEESAFVAQAGEAYETMSTAAVKALTLAKIPASAAPRFLPAIAEDLDRAARLGLDVSPEDLAEKVVQRQGAEADGFYASLPIEALADRLEAMEVEDAAKPGTKVSRLKQLMLECARRIRARTSSPVPTIELGQPPVQRPNGKREMTAAEKFDAARTFGR